MDTLNHNMNDTKSINFNNIVHDTMQKLNTSISSISSTSSLVSSNGSNQINKTKEDALHSSEVNNNNKDNDCNEHISNLSQNNAKDHNAYHGSRMGVEIEKIQQPFDQNSAKTNGYVNGHSNRSRCTIVQNFQDYHKPNR